MGSLGVVGLGVGSASKQLRMKCHKELSSMQRLRGRDGTDMNERGTESDADGDPAYCREDWKRWRCKHVCVLVSGLHGELAAACCFLPMPEMPVAPAT